MTSEIEEAVAEAEAFVAIDFRHSLRTILTALSASQAEVERLTRERDEAIREMGRYAAEAGEAKGLLEMSEAAGIVDMWRDHAQAAEARATRAEGLLAEAGEVLGRADLAPDAICKLAFQIRAPNAITPRLVLVANELQHTLRAFLAKLKGEG